MNEQAILDDPDFETPGTNKGLLSLYKYRYLLSLLVKKGTTTRYYGSALGWIWSYIRPAMQFVMYYVVLGILLGHTRGIDYFAIYLFAGIVLINLFSEVLRTTTSAVISNKALVRKIYLPNELYSIAALIGAFVHFLPQVAVLLIATLFCGWTVGWMTVVYFLVALLLVLMFSLGLGLFFGALNVVYRDARNFVDIILMFSTWASPVLYLWTMVHDRAPNWLFQIYMANPVTSAVELFHNAFWLPLSPDAARPPGLTMDVWIGIGISLFTLFIGQFVFRKLEGSFAQRL